MEARTTVEMARTIIFPAAVRYQGELAATCASLIAVKYKFDTDTPVLTGFVASGGRKRNGDERR